MMRNLLPWLTLLACLVSFSGCDSRDPYLRTDVWQPTGANAANLAAMVANPQDLIRGRGVTATDSKAPELAVENIWNDKPKQLPDMTGTSSGSSGSGSGSGGSGSGGSGSGGSGGGSSGGGAGGGSSGS